ncbi:MAG TPA: 2-hydroxychromene-2-carboxylate isomerase [Xanthobacteraceae bacterium]|nr:2-hydroxychromene-2-carboxylate isomerase [Xanthobacteraceae bacterium]
MKPSLTFWYEFASTYSWLAAERIEMLAAQAGVDVGWRPFLLGPIFAGQGWTNSPFNLFPAKGRNMWRDMERLCARMGLPPIMRPNPFPQNSLLAARVATALPVVVRPQFSCAVFRAQFANGHSIADRAVLAAILDDIGEAPPDALAAAEATKTKEALRRTTDQAQSLGIYGAPSFTTGSGELFWGNDRLEQAIAWAKNETATSVDNLDARTP